MSTHNPEMPDQSQGRRNPVMLFLGGGLIIAVLLFLLFGQSLFGADELIDEQTAVIPSDPDSILLPSSGGPLQVGDRPYEFALQDLQGNTQNLSAFVGRPIIVNFWATWCGPCRIEMPELQAVLEEHEDQCLVILALDQDESAGEVQDYFSELGLTFTPLLDDDNDTAQNYGLQGTLPSTVFINPDGEISVIHRGEMTRGQIDTFLAEIIPA